MAGRRSSRRRSRPGLTWLVVGIVLGAGLASGVFLQMHVRPPAAPHPSTGGRSRPPAPAPYTLTPPPPLPHQNPEASQGPAIGPELPTRGARGQPEHPLVAIIFDDAGYSLRAAEEVLALGRPITISVLPNLPFSTSIAEEAPTHGAQVILHLPIEPDNPAIPLGPGAITVGMSDDAIRETVVADLDTVPTASGANNHMGSRGTSDPRVMHAVIGVMRARRLFFVDSLTSPHSVAAQVAREMGVPTAVRAVFLDNQDDASYVRGQLRTLIQIAQRRGRAIAIGHVGRVTARVLRGMLPDFDEAGIRLVQVSQLVQ
jgi:uncharacterized protein